MGTENKLRVQSSLLKHLVFYREDLIVLGPVRNLNQKTGNKARQSYAYKLMPSLQQTDLVETRNAYHMPCF